MARSLSAPSPPTICLLNALWEGWYIAVQGGAKRNEWWSYSRDGVGGMGKEKQNEQGCHVVTDVTHL